MVAAAIVAVGLTAAAVLVGTLMGQQELNSANLRAANLQEQAIRLYRLGITNFNDVVALLPESCTSSDPPPAGAYTLRFTGETRTNIPIGPSAMHGTIAVDLLTNTIVYGEQVSTDQAANRTNSVVIVLPSVRIR